MNIRVNAVAPGLVKTPIWTPDRRAWLDEEKDTWVMPEQVAKVMLDLVQQKQNVGGTILEVGAESVRNVWELNDPGPKGKGFEMSNAENAGAGIIGTIKTNFGQ
jgi:3-hydroxybutyrate dehydrogenase